MADTLVALIDSSTLIKVSSTLDKTSGKKNLVDGSPETCWTSQQGLPQFIQFTFEAEVIPKRLAITFQGGFVGTRCALRIAADDKAKEWNTLTTVYPEDVNRQQIFDLKATDLKLIEGGICVLRLVFEESSDFFGRITVYDLQVEGIKHWQRNIYPRE